ncbi:MAG: NAD(P)-dependent alcohol dehydrogenase [Hamadaea sp.]|nr:NAD(P)-dependent alcohol dehydrogenase [Hamadaea sp.]
MKAYLLHAYGPPENLTLGEAPTPAPAAGEVLIRVRATSANPYDWHFMRGEPLVARFMPGGMAVRRPAHAILGCDLAGEVEAVGPGVTRLRPGDTVYALVKHGAYAEYACVAEELVARKPERLSFEEAATVPMAAVTALQAVRDDAAVRPGARILITGASGGVGSFAVQIATALGAEVTGVCSGRNAELVRSLGAERTIDYTTEDFTRTARGYDALVDIAGSPKARATRRTLRKEGVHVVVGGTAGRWFRPVDHLLGVGVAGAVSRRPTASTDVAIGASSRANLEALSTLIDAGAVTPVVHRRFAFEELPEAMRLVEQGHVPGKVAVSV